LVTGEDEVGIFFAKRKRRRKREREGKERMKLGVNKMI